LVGNPAMTPPHVHRVFNQTLVVATYVKHYRQRVSRTNTATGGIERELANRNSHSAYSLITQPQNTLAIGYNNNFDVLFSGVLQHIIKPITVWIRKEQTTLATINFGKLLTSHPHCRRINQGHDFF